MTRQERITAIGKLKPSTFNHWETKEPLAKNQMSYFIIPFAHEIYEKKKPCKTIKALGTLGWSVVNNKTKRILSDTGDGRFMDSIKLYLYDEMVPKYEKINEHFLLQKNIIFQKNNLHKEWTFRSFLRGKVDFETKFSLDGLDLLIVDKHIAFFSIKTQLSLDDNSSVSDISAKYNRNMRDFRNMYVDTQTYTFSNDEKAGVSVFEWLASLVRTDKECLLSISDKTLVEIQKKKEYYPIYNASYNAKMITAMHVAEMEVDGEEIEPAFEDDLISVKIDGTSSLEEMPFLLATTSELYPNKMWEGNEEYINEQIGNGQINIWKYWSGVVLHDSMAFFSIGDGGSAIVNSARNSYYFIYMLNLYAAYKVRYFEYELIDNEFISIENIRSQFTDLQRLKNQYMCTELSSLFQPNVVHEAIKGAMKTDDMYDEVKDNIEATLEITSRNTDIIVTALVSIFTVGGMYFNQKMLTDFFDEHRWTAIGIAVVLASIILISVKKRSTIIRLFGKFRNKFSLVSRMFD